MDAINLDLVAIKAFSQEMLVPAACDTGDLSKWIQELTQRETHSTEGRAELYYYLKDRIGSKDFFFDDNSNLGIIHLGDRPIGYVSVYLIPETKLITINGLIIDGAYRNKHIGATVLNQVLDQAKAKEYTQSTIGVYVENAPAIHLYDKLGYKPMASTYQCQTIGQVRDPFPLDIYYFMAESWLTEEWRVKVKAFYQEHQGEWINFVDRNSAEFTWPGDKAYRLMLRVDENENILAAMGVFVFSDLLTMDCPIGDNIKDTKYLIEYSLSDQKRKLYFYCPTDSHYAELIKEMGGVLEYHRLHKQL